MTVIKTLFYRHGKGKGNKAWELQIMWDLCFSLVLEFSLSFKEYPSFNINLFDFIEILVYKDKERDHAGFYLTIKFLGIWLDYSYYDIRHWDYDNDRWEEYE